MNRRAIVTIAVGLTLALSAAPGRAEQLGRLGGVVKKAQQFKDVEMTDAEEAQLGAEVSTRIRARYGVVQNAAAHKYVALVGMTLASASTKPGLAWKFIILDTDAVNAFAAPGGFIHITKGALANLKNESELAGVLAHEIIHVTEKHTIRAIQKGKLVQMGADETLAGNNALMGKLADKAYSVVEQGFGRGEELESDEKGIVLANTVGYAPQGMNGFLTMLMERNKANSTTEKNGLFASHPETKERVDKMTKEIASAKLTSTATVEARYTATITFKPVSVTEVATIETGSSGAAGATKPKAAEEEPKKKGLGGLAGRLKPSGGEQKSAQVTGSGAGRGAGSEDRLAKGGANPALVAVAVTAADVTAFKKAGGLR
ncbi:MAG: M48 family metalloprotease [Acidobacteriota bacterium]